jgi:hypothetical protein
MLGIGLGLTSARRRAAPAVPPQELIGQGEHYGTFSRASPAWSPSFPITAFAADAPRWSAAGRLIMEGARTALGGNPRGEGAVLGVLGSGGALPAEWVISANGLVYEVVSITPVGEVNRIGLRVSGTATGTSNRIRFTNFTIAQNQYVTASAFHKAVAGTQIGHTLRPSSDTVEDNGSGFTPGVSDARVQRIRLLTEAPSGLLRMADRATMTASTGYNYTYELIAPQIETGRTASSPILPAPGSYGSATRARDAFSAILAAFAQSGDFTVLAAFLVPQAAPAGSDQIIWQIDDGTDANAVRLRNSAGGSAVTAEFVVGGTVTASVSLGNYTAGTATKAIVGVSASGLSAALSAGAVQSASGARPAGLATARGGGDVAGASCLFGELGRWRIQPGRVPDGSMPGVLAAFV